MATQWAGDESAVSIHGVNEFSGGVLALLIEKDFENGHLCLHSEHPYLADGVDLVGNQFRH